MTPKEQYIEDSVAAFSRKNHDPLRENIRINTDELRTALSHAWEGGQEHERSELILKINAPGEAVASYREQLRAKIEALRERAINGNRMDGQDDPCYNLGGFDEVLLLLQENQSESSLLMKYLDKPTSEYLVSLGCTSESGTYYINDADFGYREHWVLGSSGITPDGPRKVPAFSLEDILRRDNAERIWKFAYPVYVTVAAGLVCEKYDTWTEEVSKLILSTQSKPNQEIQA